MSSPRGRRRGGSRRRLGVGSGCRQSSRSAYVPLPVNHPLGNSHSDLAPSSTAATATTSPTLLLWRVMRRTRPAASRCRASASAAAASTAPAVAPMTVPTDEAAEASLAGPAAAGRAPAPRNAAAPHSLVEPTDTGHHGREVDLHQQRRQQRRRLQQQRHARVSQRPKALLQRAQAGRRSRRRGRLQQGRRARRIIGPFGAWRRDRADAPGRAPRRHPPRGAAHSTTTGNGSSPPGLFNPCPTKSECKTPPEFLGEIKRILTLIYPIPSLYNSILPQSSPLLTRGEG